VNGERRTVVAPPDALGWVEADHGSFWAYTQATILDALDHGWTVHRTIADDLGLRWLPELAGFAELADIANLTFRADEHARMLSDLSEQLRALGARVTAMNGFPGLANE
jgi:hypothetical protein